MQSLESSSNSPPFTLEAFQSTDGLKPQEAMSPVLVPFWPKCATMELAIGGETEVSVAKSYLVLDCTRAAFHGGQHFTLSPPL